MKVKESALVWRIYRWPLLVATATIIGLITGLLGSGVADLISWAALGGLLAVMAAAISKSR